jgi:hypothetical protein
LWDRTFGGCTMILHVDGTTVPGVPALPQFVKAHVYLPPNLVEEIPDSHQPISSIVQSFIENLGIPTIKRWKRAGRNRGWPLDQAGHAYGPGLVTHALIPPPTSPSSSHYVFHGRPFDLHTSGNDLHASTVPEEVAAPRATPNSEQGDFEELDPSTLRLIDALEEIAGLRMKIDTMAEGEVKREAEYAAGEVSHKATILSLRNEIQALIGKVRAQEVEISALRARNTSYSDITSDPTSSTLPQSPISARIRSPILRSPYRDHEPYNLGSASTPVPGGSLTPRKHPFSPSRRDPSPSPASRHTGAMINLGFDLGPATAQFVRSHGLEAFAGSLSIVVRHVPVPQWHAEVHSLDLAEDLTAGLMNAMTCDWKDSGSA